MNNQKRIYRKPRGYSSQYKQPVVSDKKVKKIKNQVKHSERLDKRREWWEKKNQKKFTLILDKELFTRVIKVLEDEEGIYALFKKSIEAEVLKREVDQYNKLRKNLR